jgi:zinc transporter ZupT
MYVCMYVFAIITAAGPIGHYLLKDLTSDEIAVTSLGFRAGALMAFITQELISQAYAKYQSHIGMAATIVAF